MPEVVDTITCDGDPDDTLTVERIGEGWIAVSVVQGGDECFVNLTPASSFRAATAILLGANEAAPARAVGGESPAAIHGADAEDERQGWNIDALTAAADYGYEAEFSYQKGSGPRGIIERRRMLPKKIDTTRAGRLIVIGEDFDREETRVFRLDRIVGHVDVRPA